MLNEVLWSTCSSSFRPSKRSKKYAPYASDGYTNVECVSRVIQRFDWIPYIKLIRLCILINFEGRSGDCANCLVWHGTRGNSLLNAAKILLILETWAFVDFLPLYLLCRFSLYGPTEKLLISFFFFYWLLFHGYWTQQVQICILHVESYARSWKATSLGLQLVLPKTAHVNNLFEMHVTHFLRILYICVSVCIYV